MPTVLRHAGYRVVVFLPPREHGPPHVHVRHASGEVVIELAAAGGTQIVRSIVGMRLADVAMAFEIVAENSDYLLLRWREYHG